MVYKFKKNRTIGLSWHCLKVYRSVSNTFFQCPAWKVGTCSHMFAVMKLVTKWGFDKLTKIPELKTFTLKFYIRSVSQSREKLFKSPVSETSLILLASKMPNDIADENHSP